MWNMKVKIDLDSGEVITRSGEVRLMTEREITILRTHLQYDATRAPAPLTNANVLVRVDGRDWVVSPHDCIGVPFLREGERGQND